MNMNKGQRFDRSVCIAVTVVAAVAVYALIAASLPKQPLPETALIIDQTILTNKSVRLDELYANLQAVVQMAEMIATNKPIMSERIEQLSNATFGTGLFIGFRCKELGGTKEDLMRFVHYKWSNRLDLCEQWFKERQP